MILLAVGVISSTSSLDALMIADMDMKSNEPLRKGFKVRESFGDRRRD